MRPIADSSLTEPQPTGRVMRHLWCLLAAFALALPSMAGATTITFDDQGFTHGQVITSVPGVQIAANNFQRSFHHAVTFDSEATGTAAPGLEANPAPRWSGGNLAGEQLDMMLILQGNDIGCGDGVCDSPEPENVIPAGTFSFMFDVPIVSFGLDLIDIDGLPSDTGYLRFYDTSGSHVMLIFETLLAGYELGNNTANRVAPIDLEQLGLGPVDHVVVKLYGSSAIDNLTYTAVPEPNTALFVGLGLALLAGARRLG